MKNKYLLSVCAILLGFVFSTPAKAQVIDEENGEVVWLGTELSKALESGEYIYLYNVDKDMFINAGASYGVQGVLKSVGMRMKIESSADNVNGCYNVATRIDNPGQGNYISPNGISDANIYLDRDNHYRTDTKYSLPNWRFSVTQGSVTVNGKSETTYTYTITNNNDNSSTNFWGNSNHNVPQTLGSNNNNLLVFSNTATQWRIVTESDYIQAMKNVVWGEVDLGSFVQDSEFGRDNMDGRYWVWEGEGVTTGTVTENGVQYPITLDAYDITSSPMHWHQRNQDKMCNGIDLDNGISQAKVGRNVAGQGNGSYGHDGFRQNFAQYYAAEIYNEKIKLSQTLDLSSQGANLTEGLYKMTCQALYYDDVNGLTNDDVAYYFITLTPKNGGTPVTETLPIIPMNKVSGNNITPHSGVSAGYVFDNDANAYLLEFYVEVKKDMTLTFGIEMKKNQGWAVIGNIHMYANGKQAIFLDEDWGTKEHIEFRLYEHDDHYVQEFRPSLDEPGDDPYQLIHYNDKYKHPVTLYYQRTMTKNAWNTICLPINLTGSQIREAFGNDCDLAEIDELEVVPSNNATKGHYTIHFKSVDLDTEGIVMGKPYIIKPTNDPQVAKDVEIEVEFGNGETNQVVPITGPIYTVLGVTKKQLTEYDVTHLSQLLQNGEGKNYSTYSKPIYFTGTFYKQTFTPSDVKNGDDEYWFITKGNMYHLTGEKRTTDFTLWATYAYLHAPKSEFESNISNLSISVDGVADTMTSIEEMPILREGGMDDAAIYNLAGQKIESTSLSTLPRGIYIVNGRKYMVK